MPFFKLWMMHQNQIQSIQLVANSKNDLFTLVEKSGSKILRCKRLYHFLGVRFNDKDRQLFCEDLSLILSSDMSLKDSLTCLYKDYASEKMKILTNTLLFSVDHGMGLQGDYCKDFFNDIFCANIRLAEETGRMNNVFNRLAHHFGQRHQASHEMQKAFRYPLLILSFIFILLYLILMVMLPHMETLIPEQQQGLGFKSMIWLHQNLYLCLFLFILLSFLGVVGIRCYMDRFSLLTRLYLVNFWQNFSFCLDNDLPVLNALHLASQNLTQNLKIYTKKMEQDLKSGQSTHDSLSRFPHLTTSTKMLLKLGPTTGEFKNIIKKIAKNEQKFKKNFIEMIMFWTQPILIFMIGLILLWILSSTFLPLYDSFIYLQ